MYEKAISDFFLLNGKKAYFFRLLNEVDKSERRFSFDVLMQYFILMVKSSFVLLKVSEFSSPAQEHDFSRKPVVRFCRRNELFLA